MSELKELHEFFAASAGAAAALIGLLFVAISIAPEKIFGATASPQSRSDAERAFTALSNVFFVSLAALIPRSPLQVIAVIAALGMVQAIATALAMRRRYPGQLSWHNVGLISLAIYGFEFVSALRVAGGDPQAEKLVYIVLGLYAYAIGISWALMGAREPAAKS